ncbi:DNA-binding protein [Variovorax sp. J22G73]|nr:MULTISPECIES: DNA-binding protein [unclassified Variovorax]MDM0007885.1 DNA-binding protein [Variovorax sp. J22R203]MDM0100492.1 DNA-binding protein [Variovorax sp. J22G73]
MSRQSSQQFPPLESVTRPTVPTEWAAHFLDRRPQTLRNWAMGKGSGPIRPLRVNGRLAWPVSELKRVLGVGQ